MTAVVAFAAFAAGALSCALALARLLEFSFRGESPAAVTPAVWR